MRLVSLRFSGLALCVLALTVHESAAKGGTESGGYEVIANAFGFGIDIPGCAEASKHVHKVVIDDLVIDEREASDDPDSPPPVGPGRPRFGNVTLSIEPDPQAESEARTWFLSSSLGNKIPRNIMVVLHNSKGETARGYQLLACVPVDLTEETDPSTQTSFLKLVARIGGLHFFSTAKAPHGRALRDLPSNDPLPKALVGLQGPVTPAAEPPTGDKFDQVRGFAVDITNSSGREVDAAWESVSGGDLVIEQTETTTGSDRFQTPAPGHKSVGTISLKGSMTDHRAALCTWINEVVQGKPWKRNLTITELLSVDGAVKPGKAYHYNDSWPTRYVFPVLSTCRVSGNVQEAFVFKGVRHHVEAGPVRQISLEIPQGVRVDDILAVRVEDLNIDVDRFQRTGNALLMTATFELLPASLQQILPWLQDPNKKEIPRTLRVLLFRHLNHPIRTIDLLDSVFLSASESNASTEVRWTLTVRVGRIEMK